MGVNIGTAFETLACLKKAVVFIFSLYLVVIVVVVVTPVVAAVVVVVAI